MRRFLLFSALALVLLVSCSSKEKLEAPEPLLTEQQMIDVLTDSYLIESMLKKTAGENVASLQTAYYDQLMDHYGITDSIFDANMEYYSHDLATLERIMDSVNNRFLNAQEKE